LKLNVPQQAIIIGVPAYRQGQDVSLGKIIAMPFASQPPSWQLPERVNPDDRICRKPRTAWRSSNGDILDMEFGKQSLNSRLELRYES
jgi:hypothetical protein